MLTALFLVSEQNICCNIQYHTPDKLKSYFEILTVNVILWYNRLIIQWKGEKYEKKIF